jgi:hypothetical protein
MILRPHVSDTTQADWKGTTRKEGGERIMPEPPRVIIIAKEREFDEERWKELLTALAYLLHERRQKTSKDRRPTS